ncbi:FKBP-type peptidyl-prolyl cis-trans isomerase [Lacibacter cauensis]|nr:FKBP-type peptidyl-prolyl cis-trans isomerase [Lacibacter cauensis]
MLLFCMIAACVGHAAAKDSLSNYALPDSLRANGLLAQVHINKISTKKEAKAGIQADGLKLFVEADRKEQDILFSFPAGAIIVTKGIDVDEEDGNSLEWEHAFAADKPVQLYIATASDSALNYTLYSGYVFLPDQNKWKLIGTCKVNGKWGNIKSASSYTANLKKQPGALQIQQVWVQRGNGSLKELSATAAKAPVLMPFSNVDSIQQATFDEKVIQDAIASGKTDAKEKAVDVYYSIVKEGTGKSVAVTDTVTVFYKGYLFSDGSVFDQTKEKPATFPLNRLIRGWQLALPYCKVGGKIKIVIPSGLAYSIRTRSPKIPPNSILVFEIEVVEAKPQQ